LNKLCRGYGYNYLSWLESHETLYKITLFCEHFFKMFVIFQIYYFSSQIGHITWHNANVFYFFGLFWITYTIFEMLPKRRAWPFLDRDRILQKSLWISDEIDTCVPKNDFWKKSWANYKAHVVQIWPASIWINIYLSISLGMARIFFPCK
jgi:hypothetical protein